jgi:putative transposase
VCAIASELETLLKAHIREMGCECVALQIMPDHVHLFINCPPSLSPDKLMFRLKGRSSRLMRLKYPSLAAMTSLWTRSYFVSTAGNVSATTVQKYIEEQKTRS